ncbi:MAG: bis(5'-nucleosyl)-tetraphosphatase (symmetrical) YqeK [Aphanocapsa sp. GSE-SYN-MK-11-07L]|jgi:predicted HD superfamily hydrolase involved in NAD metabolism|nr:bis(5'-nucleosyl)-tetraphosphatase (symmetrical) YqeK [Aphanocapsa sp. GSE-SYN-MK-11-07L]
MPKSLTHSQQITKFYTLVEQASCRLANHFTPELPRERVLSWLSQNVPKPRLQHILRVEQTAIALAQHHQLAVDKAAQAGLLHDLAKYFEPERLLAMAKAEGLALTEVDLADPHLLHADVSAIVARDEFAVSDPEILAAVRNHTLGQPGMSQLCCVVFLADSLEPGRGTSPELEDIRQACLDNLYQAVLQVCDRTFAHLINHHRLIHPRMVLTRNWALQLSSDLTTPPPKKLNL